QLIGVFGSPIKIPGYFFPVEIFFRVPYQSMAFSSEPEDVPKKVYSQSRSPEISLNLTYLPLAPIVLAHFHLLES
ncbi:MAG: hypothetical protein R6V00_03535, partial [Candidatus Aminicenantes bacterium]